MVKGRAQVQSETEKTQICAIDILKSHQSPENVRVYWVEVTTN